MPVTRGRGILKERQCKGKGTPRRLDPLLKCPVQRTTACVRCRVPEDSPGGIGRDQWHSHTAVFRHEAPPLGHSSPGAQKAGLSPQLTEQPPQVPRGLEGKALQEFSCVVRSEAGGPEAAVLGGPLSVYGAPWFFALVVQPQQTSSVTAKAEISAGQSAIGRVLIRPACYACRARPLQGVMP